MAGTSFMTMRHPAFCLLLVSTLLPFLTGRAEEGEGMRMRTEMLKAHNRIRSRLSLPYLGWSEPLSEAAQLWANTLVKEDGLRHSADLAFGENLYRIDGGEATPRMVVDAWASESSRYNYKTNKCRGRCGHYTQIVWKDTTQVGCAVASAGDHEIWVCEYNPPGNIIGERPY
jgi:pathogenesis-related protein 1